ncbi:MAG: single-stranded DNA-binding protein [Acidobacteriia bacterium]|nr:single-stranded DNA-binding protein [Terriglobia bacterium]
MPSLNRVTLLGHLGHDPEVRTTSKGTTVAGFRMATTSRRKDPDSGERTSHAEWHRVVAFGQQAEFLGSYAKKGALVLVEGPLQTREWTDREGVKRYTTEVVARQVQLLGKKEQPAAEAPRAEEPPAPEEPAVPEDDIPF